MDTDIFFRKINTYTNLTREADLAWTALLTERMYPRGEHFISVGQIPKKVAFVVKGLFPMTNQSAWSGAMPFS